MLTALKTKEACSKQNKENYDDIPQYKIHDLVMIRNFDKQNQIWMQSTYLISELCNYEV